MSWVLTTVLHFADRMEGQVLHRGTHEECQRMMEATDAVAYDGDEAPRGCFVRIFETDNPELYPGRQWELKTGSGEIH